MQDPPTPTALADRLLSRERSLPSSRLGRLFGTTRAGANLARAVLSSTRGTPDLGRLARVVEQVGDLKGVAMKAGQILGYMDPGLDQDVRAMLSVLQKSAAATPWSAVERTLRDAFGPRADDLLGRLERAPLAVASVGQVHRATLADGRAVVVKVRHPGIDVAFTQDLAGAGLGSLFAGMFVSGAGTRVRDLVDEARTAFLEECDYGLEAARQRRFAEAFADHPRVVVPAVVPEWCASTVLTTEYHPGVGLEAFAATATQASRDRAAEALFDLYVGTLYRHGLFHADPHPGNFAFLPGDGVVVYDYGCVRTFDAHDVRAFSALSSAVASDDLAGMVAAFGALGGGLDDAPRSRATLRTLLRGFFAPMLERGPHPIRTERALGAAELFEDKRALLGLGVPGRMLFLFRLRFGLYAVFERLGARLDWGVLEARARAGAVGAARAAVPPRTLGAP